MKVEVVPATLEHALEVLDDVRPADLREWYAATGRPFEAALRDTFQSDDEIRVALLDGRPVIFWGWDADGIVWMFATGTAERHAVALHLVLARRFMEEIVQGKSRLSATADARNEKHHTWLRWLGFEDAEEVTVGPFGLPFIHFVKEL
jgi:hypothetical protein